jgi:hypothetical protein
MEQWVPLSFRASAVAGVDFIITQHTDIQELNSIAANQHYNPNSTYYDLHTNNRQCILTGVVANNSYLADPNDPNFAELCQTHKHDANGATILHQCFQHRKYDLVKWFVNNYPTFSLEPHLLNKLVDGRQVKLPYGGQNILHMAVLAKNHSMAKWILDFYSRLSDRMLHELLTARVYTQSGYFGKKQDTGKHYYGETPLQFAVCMDDVDMVNLVMSFASLLEPFNIRLGKSTRNLLFYPDCNGNNVVHLCVKGSLHKMYEHIKYFAVEMLQQELMVALHQSLQVANVAEVDLTVDYDGYFNELIGQNVQNPQNLPNPPDEFRFRGHVRRICGIRLPEAERRDFLLAQVYKHLDDQDTKLDAAAVTAVIERLPNTFGITAQDLIDMAIQDGYPQLISELKRKLSRWLYGIEIGVKSGEINRMFHRFFIYGLNEDGHSPITLAASDGKALMLRHFLKENVCQKDRGYEFDLTGIEFKLEGQIKPDNGQAEPFALYAPALPNHWQLESSVTWICRSYDADIYSMVNTIPEIAYVVDYKWKRVGASLFQETFTFEIFICFLCFY